MLHGGSLAGFVFFDADGDGTRDASEDGVPGIVVRLSGSETAGSSVDQSTITDNNGAYSFDELEPGTYQIAKRQNAATIDCGTDAGVIVTPRSKNAATIVVTSLTRQLTLDTYDATTIRNFINTNRGHSPEGYIPSGQRTDISETLDDGLPHAP